jgi:hypothetical protein
MIDINMVITYTDRLKTLYSLYIARLIILKTNGETMIKINKGSYYLGLESEIYGAKFYIVNNTLEKLPKLR